MSTSERNKFSTYEVQLHVPHCFYSEISEKSDVWRSAKRDGGDTKETVRDGGDHTDQRSSMPGPCTYDISIPPKKSVSEVMSRLKGKSALMIFDRHPEYRNKMGRHFWARGYYVETVGNVNEEVIKRYIAEQEESDRIEG